MSLVPPGFFEYLCKDGYYKRSFYEAEYGKPKKNKPIRYCACGAVLGPANRTGQCCLCRPKDPTAKVRRAASEMRRRHLAKAMKQVRGAK